MWGTQEFPDTAFAEHFSVSDEKAKLVAKFADGTTAGYEHGYGKGSAILLGTFVGQSNEAKPVAMHPLGGILATWAAGTEGSDTGRTARVGRRKGISCFSSITWEKAAEVEFTEELGRSAANLQEIVIGDTRKVGGKKVCSEDRSPGAGG